METSLTDRQILERAEARVLYRTWLWTKQKVLTPERIEMIEKRYGPGSVGRIRDYMNKIRNGEMD